MTVQEAAHDLYQHLCKSHHPNWLGSIGCADVGQYNGEAYIGVMLVREPHRFEWEPPATWQGYRLDVKVVGRMRLCGEGDR